MHYAKSVYINGILKYISTERNPIYAYRLAKERLKIYRPLARNSQAKWRCNTKSTDFHIPKIVWEQPTQLLILTSSCKDAMVLHELGYRAIAPASEMSIPPQELISKLKDAYPHIVFFMDSDKAGMTQNYKLSRMYKCPYLVIPNYERLGVKDISDYREKYGEESTKKTINKMLSKAFSLKKAYEDMPF